VPVLAVVVTRFVLVGQRGGRRTGEGGADQDRSGQRSRQRRRD
jgi:hypothetical protein